MYLSIIIPAHNEQYRIKRTISKIIYYIKRNNIDAQIIIIDDGSKDETYRIINVFRNKHNFIVVVKNEKNMGKGFSVRRGVLLAEGDFILFTDADNSTPISEVKKLLSYLENGQYDVAIGSRALKDSKIKIRQPLFRLYMGKIFNRLVKFFLYKDFHDTQCGFKLFNQKAAKEIFELQQFNGFSFDIEILYLAKIKNYKIIEVPIT